MFGGSLPELQTAVKASAQRRLETLVVVAAFVMSIAGPYRADSTKVARHD